MKLVASSRKENENCHHQMKKMAVFTLVTAQTFRWLPEFPVEFVFQTIVMPYVTERFRQARHSVLSFELKEFWEQGGLRAALVELLEEHQIDLVCWRVIWKSSAQPCWRLMKVNYQHSSAYFARISGAHGIGCLECWCYWVAWPFTGWTPVWIQEGY